MALGTCWGYSAAVEAAECFKSSLQWHKDARNLPWMVSDFRGHDTPPRLPERTVVESVYEEKSEYCEAGGCGLIFAYDQPDKNDGSGVVVKFPGSLKNRLQRQNTNETR